MKKTHCNVKYIPKGYLLFFKVCDNSLHVNKVDIGWHHCVSLHSNLAKSVRIF